MTQPAPQGAAEAARRFPYRLTVSIVTWNSRRDLELCLPSLQRGACDEPLEVIVVDNGSRDGTVALVRHKFPWVRVIQMDMNRGFATANNRALTAARGRDVLLLNPDTIVHPGALTELLRFLSAHPRAGAVGARLLNPDGSLQMSCRRFPDFGAGLFRNTPLGRLFPRNAYTARYLMTDWDHRVPRRVDWLSGACCLVRREVLETVGLLDDRFFLYCEDVDWCYRMAQAGWERWYVPSAKVTHRVGGSSDQRVLGAVLHFHESMYRFYRKNYCTGWLRLVQPVAGAGIALRALGAISRFFWQRAAAFGRERRRRRPVKH